MPGDAAAGGAFGLRGRRRRGLSFTHFAALAVVAALVAASAVPFPDLAFALLSLPYLFLLSSLSFPPSPAPSSPASPPPSFTRSKPVFSAYLAVAALLGLLLPVAYIAHDLLFPPDDGDDGRGRRHALAAAAPHLFLVAAQVFLEGVAAASGFSLPAFAAVPIAYNSRRMFALADWVRRETANPSGGQGGLSPRILAGRALAAANLVFWAFNLFGFLLPIFLPWALKTHYSSAYCKDGDLTYEKDRKK